MSWCVLALTITDARVDNQTNHRYLFSDISNSDFFLVVHDVIAFEKNNTDQ